MRPPNEHTAIQQIEARLSELIDFPAEEVTISHPAEEVKISHPTAGYRADAVVDIGGVTFVIVWKSTSSLALIARAAEQTQRYASGLSRPAIPLVAVPFMGKVGRAHCREAGYSWLDLSGNAHIVAPGLRIRIEGQPNLFKRPGRPSSPFAPKSARIARWLLLHPNQSMTQREIARATNMDEGFTSRIVSRLEDDELVIRQPSGAIQVREPDLLLDAWRGDYDASKHKVLKGHIAARSSITLLHRLAKELHRSNIRYAITGMAAAWVLTPFAGFRIVSTYVADRPQATVLDRLGFRENATGANTWLLIPSDSGVFHGAVQRDGVHCVHPVQAYLDLKGLSERAEEAATNLRTSLLTWKASG